MKCSASKRESKREKTARQLMTSALHLTAEHGYDGWTIDTLADHADVSRRTVFNYFDTKADIVLGPAVELAPQDLAVFIGGGPTGVLIDDVLVVAGLLFDDHVAGHEQLATERAIVASDPVLVGLMHNRFEELISRFAGHVLEREGEEYGEARASLLVRLLVAMCDTVLDRLEADPTRTFNELFAEAVTDARGVLTD